MDGLIRFSFYLFAASSIALCTAAVCYIIYAIGRVRVQRQTLATSTGATVTGSRTLVEPGPVGFANWGLMLVYFGAFFAGASVLTRGIAAERYPLANMYEFSLSFVLFLSVLYIIFEHMYKVRQMGAIVVTIASLMTVYIWSLPTHMREIDPLIPALQAGQIMTWHVGAAVLAYATFALSFASAVFYLIAANRNIHWLPSAEMLDDIGFRAVTFGFPMFTINLILGSVWAHEAWGTYWQWDPKETAALFTWLVYAVYLHTRTLRGWRGNRSAWVLIFGFFAAIFTYYGNYFFGGLHAYGGV